MLLVVPELTPPQWAALARLRESGFEVVPNPLFPNGVVVRKRNCAAVLAPVPSDAMRFLAGPAYLIDGNLSVRVTRAGRDWFVWKNKQIEATPERQGELAEFTAELEEALLSKL